MNDIVITAKNNPKIKEVNKLTSSASERRNSGLFVAEGVRLCLDARDSGCEIDSVFCTEKCLLKNFEAVSEIRKSAKAFYTVSADVMKSMSDTVTPQGIICTVKIAPKSFSFNKTGKYIALDTIQTPDNLGAVMRTAEALGIDGIIVAGGCDIYNPKALRASMGAVFRLPVKVTESLEDVISECSRTGIKTYATVPDREALSVTDVDFSAGALSVIGNEGNGVRKNIIDICSDCVTIKMNGRAESLNAAAASSIIMWEMVK